MSPKIAPFLIILLFIAAFIRSQFFPMPKPGFEQILTPMPTPTPSPTPSPTPRPLTFQEMQQLYGPCVNLPVLMYHHVQDQALATANNQSSLTVNPDTFRSQLEYLRTKNYQSIHPQQIADFFDAHTPLPPKPFLLTFDDAYADFYTVAFPILKEFAFPATVFVPTGLVENPGYLTWNQITDMAGQNIYFANHTWSHKNVATTAPTIEQEISTAQTQLENHGLNPRKIFAYPYGLGNGTTQNYLSQQNYSLAFTTIPGRILCRGQRLTLPRLRIGNSSLSSF